MNHVLAIAKKELRAYFLSPVALIFLGLFLFATLFWFFTMEQFWVRNIADIRPLFSSFPVMLIFLSSALTMRLWSEEQKVGTMEMLFTLPVKIHALVLGKFLAGLALVGLALLLTLHVPILVSMHGDLDWGPVVGGYLGTLLLAGAYLAIGLCMSALTEIQIVSLILSVVVCGAFYLVGSDSVTAFVNNDTAETLRAIGTGSRFESIGRGVLDLRDLLYYASLTTLFLVLNTVILLAKRWSDGARTRGQRTNAKLMVGLVTANLLALGLWMHNVRAARVDITERKEFSVSQVTETMVRGLDAPLLLRGYFSEKTHPLLAPLVPKIRDLLQEYGAISGGQVSVEFVDPTGKDELEKEAGQSYGIKSFPFRVASKYEAGVVNSYFSILVKYGDQYEVLNFDDLIEVHAAGDEPEVKLRNLEYDVTRAIKKTAYGFQTLETVFADISEPIEFMAYITPKTLPPNFQTVPANVTKVLEELKSVSGGKFKYSITDPDDPANASVREELFRKFRIRPMAVSPFGEESFYLNLILRVGDRYEAVMPAEGMDEADIKKEIVAALKRSTPGFLKTVGLVKPKTEAPPQQMPGMPPQTPPDLTRMLNEKLQENYTVQNLTLDDGRVPGDVDVLLVVQPEDFSEKQAYAVDQYLMRGGSVIVVTGHYVLDPHSGQQRGIQMKRISSGLESVLAAWGVTVQDTMVMDPQNDKFPVPVVRDLGGFRVQQIQLMSYPYFVDIRGDGLHPTSPIVGGLPGVTMQWASPLVVSAPEAKEGEAPAREVVELLRSSPGAWTRSENDVQPNFEKHPGDGFGAGTDTKSHVLAVAVHGRFDSAFKDKPSPLFGDGESEGADRTGRTIKESPDSARLVVFGSPSFVNDMVLGISRQTGGERIATNLQLVENVIDWSVSDTDLLSIRSRGTFARTLASKPADDRRMWELGAYGLVVLALGLIIALTAGGRRRMRQIDLVGEAPRRGAPVGKPREAQS